jgi:hypothetical protein
VSYSHVRCTLAWLAGEIRTSKDGKTTFPFELHVGVGYGPIQSVCVGSGSALSGGWMFYVGGNGIDTMLEAFNAATGANQASVARLHLHAAWMRTVGAKIDCVVPACCT